MNGSLKVVKDLSEVFPDIEGQLCSRHSILFGKLKNTYNKLYDQLDPQNYIIVKGVLDIFSDGETSLCLGLENGIILMSRQIDINADIYINGNHFDEEIVMTSKGQLQEGLHVLSDEITVAIETAIEDVLSEQLHGTILYLHSNIPQDCFHYRQVLLISIFLGVSLINNSLLGLSIEQIIDKLAKRQIFGNQTFLKRLFSFHNKEFSLVIGDKLHNIPMQKQNRMVFCQLDLAKHDIKHQRERRKQLQYKKQYILQAYKRENGLDSMLQICSCEAQQKLNLQTEMKNEDDMMETGKFIQNYTQHLTILQDFSQQKVNLQQLVNTQWSLNSKHWKIHSQQVIELIEHIKTAFKLSSCMVVNESIALIVADKAKCTEMLVFLRQKLHKGELKSKSLFKIEQELVQSRWNSDKHIGEKMFTSIPSCGVSIIDPKQSIWFE